MLRFSLLFIVLLFGLFGLYVLQPVDRHHPAVPPVVFRPPLPVSPGDGESGCGGDGVHGSDGGWHDLLADSVTCDDVDGVIPSWLHDCS